MTRLCFPPCCAMRTLCSVVKAGCAVFEGVFSQLRSLPRGVVVAQKDAGVFVWRTAMRVCPVAAHASSVASVYVCLDAVALGE